MKQIFISSVQKEFERERAAIKRMIESDPILKPHFKAFVFEIDAPAADKTTQQVYLKEIEKSDIYLVLIGNKYGYCDDGGVSPTEQEFDKAKELGLTPTESPASPSSTPSSLHSPERESTSACRSY